VLDIIDGRTTTVQRALRRGGLAGREVSTSAALLALFDGANPGFVFFDVGANIGLYSWLCAALFEPAAVVAFEPSPETAATARAIVDRNGLSVRVEQMAVGAEPGTATLHLSAVSDASNSLAEGFKPSVGTVAVPVTTLDTYVRGSGLVPSVIKIDVESLEPEVLKGARETLQSHRPALVVEILNRQGTDHGPLVAAAMEGLGYSGYRLGPEPRWEPGQRWSGSDDHRDWLLLPSPVDGAFIGRFEDWRARLATCTPDRNRGRGRKGPAPDPAPVASGAGQPGRQQAGDRRTVGTTRLDPPTRTRSLPRRVFDALPGPVRRRVRALRDARTSHRPRAR
jgi:FkbM family methyltransferase